jgi:hypothetical protein
MVRRAEGSTIREHPADQLSCHRLDHRHIKQFARAKRRQNGRKALGQHGFSRAGRTDHEKVMTTCGGHFEGSARQRLPANIGEIG